MKKIYGLMLLVSSISFGGHGGIWSKEVIVIDSDSYHRVLWRLSFQEEVTIPGHEQLAVIENGVIVGKDDGKIVVSAKKDR